MNNIEQNALRIAELMGNNNADGCNAYDKVNPEWCLMWLDERTHDEPDCSANMRGEIINIVSCK